MPNARTLKYAVLIVAVAVAILLFPVLADAQCSMCRAVLSNSNPKFIRNLNIGILVLLVPPVSMFCTIFIVLRRHHREDVTSREPGVADPHIDQDSDSRSEQ